MDSADNPASGTENDNEAATPTVSPEQLKRAMKAFRKRLKLTKLDDESKLNSRNAMSSGRKSQIAAIQAPREYPIEVWQELARQGKLKHHGGWFYELVE